MYRALITDLLSWSVTSLIESVEIRKTNLHLYWTQLYPKSLPGGDSLTSQVYQKPDNRNAPYYQ